MGLKHIGRGGQRPVALRSVSRADAEIAERILRVIIHRTQLLLLGHAVLDNALYCRSQQRVQLGRAGDVAAVVVKLERADELVMVKLLVIVDMEQLAANVMPARRQIGSLLIERSPLFGAARLVKLMVSGCLKHIPVCPVRVRHIRHNTDVLTRIDRKLICLTAEHTVEDGYRLRTGNRCIRAEIRACRNPALCQSGLHRIVRPVGLGYISERLVRADVGVREARQNRYKLCTGNLSVRLERAVRVAVHQTETGHLTNSVRIPRGNRNVIKQMVLILDLVHQQRGQQLARFCTGDGCIRTKGAVRVAVHILHVLCGIQLRLRCRILSRARGNRQGCRHQSRKRTCGHSFFHHTSILSFRSFSGIVLN